MNLKKLINFKLVLATLVAILFLVGVTYFINEINAMERINQERKAISDKVTLVMELYNCHDQAIHAAIMETFDPVLIAIVIGVESEYRVDAVSSTGCRGLMQLSPDKLADWKDVKKNITVGAGYLQEQINRFGSLELAVAAYNAGPGAVTRYKGVPPFRETRQYIEKTKLLSLAFDHFLPWTAEVNRPLL
ncbi:MAG: lytic transglycosylase domain-containing protein [Bacillota bacterium]